MVYFLARKAVCLTVLVLVLCTVFLLNTTTYDLQAPEVPSGVTTWIQKSSNKVASTVVALSGPKIVSTEDEVEDDEPEEEPREPRFAYVQYATDLDYFCNAVSFTHSHLILLLLSKSTDSFVVWTRSSTSNGSRHWAPRTTWS